MAINKKQKEALQKICINRKIIERIREVRLRQAVPLKNGFSTDENFMKWFVRRPRLNFAQEVDLLMGDFDIPTYLRGAIENLIRFNKTGGASPIIIKTELNPKTKQMECFIQIFGDTTCKDVTDNWKPIQEIQKGNNFFHTPLPAYKKRYKSLVNLERDEQLRRWREDEGLSLNETAKRAAKAGYKIAITEIPKLIKRHKKNIGEEN